MQLPPNRLHVSRFILYTLDTDCVACVVIPRVLHNAEVTFLSGYLRPTCCSIGIGLGASGEKRTDRSHDESEPGKTCFGHFGQQLEPASDSSTRRFCARPCAVSFEATGFEAPNPCAETRSGFTPSETTYSITFSARL
jgi:hypothetical protein